jgi:hypothetical protein
MRVVSGKVTLNYVMVGYKVYLNTCIGTRDGWRTTKRMFQGMVNSDVVVVVVVWTSCKTLLILFFFFSFLFVSWHSLIAYRTTPQLGSLNELSYKVVRNAIKLSNGYLTLGNNLNWTLYILRLSDQKRQLHTMNNIQTQETHTNTK